MTQIAVISLVAFLAIWGSVPIGATPSNACDVSRYSACIMLRDDSDVCGSYQKSVDCLIEFGEGCTDNQRVKSTVNNQILHSFNTMATRCTGSGPCGWSTYRECAENLVVVPVTNCVDHGSAVSCLKTKLGACDDPYRKAFFDLKIQNHESIMNNCPGLKGDQCFSGERDKCLMGVPEYKLAVPSWMTKEECHFFTTNLCDIDPCLKTLKNNCIGFMETYQMDRLLEAIEGAHAAFQAQK